MYSYKVKVDEVSIFCTLAQSKCSFAGYQTNLTLISGSATTYGFRSLSPNARETARTPPTRQVPEELNCNLVKHKVLNFNQVFRDR